MLEAECELIEGLLAAGECVTTLRYAEKAQPIAFSRTPTRYLRLLVFALCSNSCGGTRRRYVAIKRALPASARVPTSTRLPIATSLLMDKMESCSRMYKHPPSHNSHGIANKHADKHTPTYEGCSFIKAQRNAKNPTVPALAQGAPTCAPRK